MKDDLHSDDIETLWAVRIKESRARFVKELVMLCVIMGGIAIGFIAFATLQLVVCRLEHKDMGVLQCFRVERILK